MANNTKKELTLDDIAELIKESSEKTEKVIEAKIEASVGELATMTQNHFLILENDVKDIKSDVGDIKADMNKKVDTFTHNDLTYRVEKLEEKNGITLKKNLATAT